MPCQTFDVNAFVALAECFAGAHCNLILLCCEGKIYPIGRNDIFRILSSRPKGRDLSFCVPPVFINEKLLVVEVVASWLKHSDNAMMRQTP